MQAPAQIACDIICWCMQHPDGQPVSAPWTLSVWSLLLSLHTCLVPLQCLCCRVLHALPVLTNASQCLCTVSGKCTTLHFYAEQACHTRPLSCPMQMHLWCWLLRVERASMWHDLPTSSRMFSANAGCGLLHAYLSLSPLRCMVYWSSTSDFHVYTHLPQFV